MTAPALLIFSLFALIPTAAQPRMANTPLLIVASNADFPEQTSNEGGVVVKVKPAAIGTDTGVWSFSVTFETHTGALTEDPAKLAVLVDPNGATYPPIRWKGDPAGGHHRKGVLLFPAPAQRSGSFQLRMRNVGGVSERVFRWDLPPTKN